MMENPRQNIKRMVKIALKYLDFDYEDDQEGVEYCLDYFKFLIDKYSKEHKVVSKNNRKGVVPHVQN